MSRPGLTALILLALFAPAAASAQAIEEVQTVQAPAGERFAEQGILTPIPIEIVLPERLTAQRVLVHYRAFGSKAWTTLELKQEAGSWRGAIPCLEVSTITGVLRYYIRVYDARGAVIATSGSRDQPYQVKIKNDPRGTEKRGARRCPDPADCPRGLPGCGSEQVERVPCHSDDDCEGGLSCGFEGFCETGRRTRDLFSLTLEQDFSFVPTTDACSAHSQSTEGFSCFRQNDGVPYRGVPLPDQNHPVRAGLGPSRVVAGYDRVILEYVTLGLHAGWAFHGERRANKGMPGFVPLHAEARLGYWFGADPFKQSGFRPFALMGAGAGQFDTVVEVKVTENVRKSTQPNNEFEQTLDASQRAGDYFVEVGAGMLVGGSPRGGWLLTLRALEVFPFTATVLAVEAGRAIGF